MCAGSGFKSSTFNPASRLLGRKYQIADPLMYNLEQSEARYTSAPQLPTPTQPQELKSPDINSYRAAGKRRAPVSTMLTGSTGLTAGSLTTGGTTLLGG